MANPDYNKAINFGQMSDADGEIVGSLGTIYLTGGGFYRRAFSGISSNSQFGWQEMVWKKSPTRGEGFSFVNISDINVGLVARCEITIPYNNIRDYMDLRKIIARERFFKARFYDVDEGIWVEREMYCSENSRSQLFTLGKSLIGVRDITVKLVGTNRDADNSKINISYDLNGGNGNINSLAVIKGTEITLPNPNILNIIAPTGKHFDHWETRTSGNETMGTYHAGQETTAWNDMKFYAIWA
jgi:hypothetical protein